MSGTAGHEAPCEDDSCSSTQAALHVRAVYASLTTRRDRFRLAARAGAADDKAAELKRLGVDPTFGLTEPHLLSDRVFRVSVRLAAGEPVSSAARAVRVFSQARCVWRTPLFMGHAGPALPRDGAAASRPLRAGARSRRVRTGISAVCDL
jgi:hypothetical protein